MALRWRADGRLLCAAMFPEEQRDTYIDDRLHYYLSVEARVLIGDIDHFKNGLWHWVHGAEAPFLRAVNENAWLADPRRTESEGDAKAGCEARRQGAQEQNGAVASEQAPSENSLEAAEGPLRDLRRDGAEDQGNRRSHHPESARRNKPAAEPADGVRAVQPEEGTQAPERDGRDGMTGKLEVLT